jgi:hypothetical protein
MSPEGPWGNPMALISYVFDFGGVVMTWTTSTYRPRVKTPQKLVGEQEMPNGSDVASVALVVSPRTTGVRHKTERSSPGSLHPDCWARS